jgi:glucose/arabinose dehydrogenase
MSRWLQRSTLSLIVFVLLRGSTDAQPYRVDTLARAPFSQYPVALAFITGGGERFFFTEKSSGRVRFYSRGLRPDPFAIVNVDDDGEQGLLGLALHPRYPLQPYLYLFATRKLDRASVVIRYRDSSGIGVEPTLLAIIPRLDEGAANIGGCLRFGPDGMLYVSVGDYGVPANAQDLSGKRNYAGKLVRLNPDGTLPADSPFPDRPYWSIGHRNPTAFTFDPVTGGLYCLEGGTDQPNRIFKVPPGANLGWGSENVERTGGSPTIRPLYTFAQGNQPGLTSVTVYRGTAFPRLQGRLLIAGYANPTIWTGNFRPGEDSITLEPFFRTNVGYASVEVAPDGGIVFANGPYISSRILKISPVVPGFLSSPPVNAIENMEYAYTPSFSGTLPGLVLLNAPRGMVVDSTTWTVRWTPSRLQATQEKFTVTLRAENGGGFAEQRFVVRVTNVNDPPGLFALRQVPGGKIAGGTGQEIEQTFRWERATDADADSVRYTFQIDTSEAFNSPMRIDSLTYADSLHLFLPKRNGTYFWRVWASDGRLSVLSVPPSSTVTVEVLPPVALRVEKERPREQTLEQNFPNPFNPMTSIKYTLPHAGYVRLAVFNLLGQEVAVLVDGVQSPGNHDVEFGKANLPSGIYFYRLQAPGVFETRKMVIAK